MYTKVQQNLAFDNTSTLESHYVVGKNNVRGCFLNILWGTYVEVLYTVSSRVNWTEAVLSCSKPGYTIADTYSFNKFLEEERLILFWVGIFRREFIKIDTGRYADFDDIGHIFSLPFFDCVSISHSFLRSWVVHLIDTVAIALYPPSWYNNSL